MVNPRLKSLGKFTFHFSTAVYLLAVPFMWLIRGGDALLPYESALCIGLSTVNGSLAVRNAWKAVK